MNVCFVEIVEEGLDERSGVKDGRNWQVRRQQAYLHQGEPYPSPLNLFLDDGQLPYKPGRYLFAGGSFRLNKGFWEFSRGINLIPVEQALGFLANKNSPAPIKTAA